MAPIDHLSIYYNLFGALVTRLVSGNTASSKTYICIAHGIKNARSCGHFEWRHLLQALHWCSSIYCDYSWYVRTVTPINFRGMIAPTNVFWKIERLQMTPLNSRSNIGTKNIIYVWILFVVAHMNMSPFMQTSAKCSIAMISNYSKDLVKATAQLLDFTYISPVLQSNWPQCDKNVCRGHLNGCAYLLGQIWVN